MTNRDTLRAALQEQRAAHEGGAPDYRARMRSLAVLRDALRDRQEELVDAVNADFGGRAREETLVLELLPLYQQIRHARRHLRGWMKRRRVPSTWFLRPSRAFYQYQPLGVVGVLGAWNYQLLLTLGPVVDALAAGNHVMLKPSEVTPRSADVIAAMLADAFAPEQVRCFTGGPEVAREFSALPFDHLCFTGSGRVGRLVMRSAAENLTPVTLELGGKSPAIVHSSYPLPLAVERIVIGKLLNAGQTCVAPDYVLVPEGADHRFEAEARRVVRELYPRLQENPDYTRIATESHYRRLVALLEDAAEKGARIESLGPRRVEGGEDRVFPPTLVFGATDDMQLMREEIFGPILPVLSVPDVAAAISFVNERPRPLALYYFDEDRSRVDHMLSRTMSGGVGINDCIYHLAQNGLPFGGVGQSGMGHYHGFDGFVTFSKKRGVMVQPRRAGTSLLRAPYAGRRRLLALLLKLASR